MQSHEDDLHAEATAGLDLSPEISAILSDAGVTIVRPGEAPDAAPSTHLFLPLVARAVTDTFDLHSNRIAWVGADSIAVPTVATRGTGAVFAAFIGPDAQSNDLTDYAAAGIPRIVARDHALAQSITHGLDGLVVDSTCDGAAWAIRHLQANPRDGVRYALTAKRGVSSHDLTLMDACLADLSVSADRRRVVITSTFAIDAPVNGGQRRLRHLAGELARLADVEILVLSQHAEIELRQILAPGLTQIEVPRSREQKDAELQIYKMLGSPTDDMTAADLAATTPAWATVMAERLVEADLVIASHPYLAPTIPTSPEIPFVYDSHNAETAFKRSILPDDENGRWLLDATERAERNATERSHLISACTQADLDEIRLLDSADHRGITVSNGVDVEALPFASDPDRERARWELLDLAGVNPYSDRPIVTFIGSSHGPNVSAAGLLLDAAARRPEWLFILAGSHSSVFAENDAPLPPNVTLVPVFDEGLLWPLIAGASVAANPMVSGGGSNLKIFDYLAVGTPVLATPIGARGLDDPTSLIELVEPTLDALVQGLDQLIEPDLAPLRRQRAERGRAYVESNVSWRILGQQWSAALGSLVGGWIGPVRPRLASTRPIILLDTPPPSSDPVVAAMQRVGSSASGGHPTDREITMDPAFREHIRKAKANKNVGRELPDDARLALPKKALIRAGHALSNEQAVFNDASLDAMERLMGVINDLQRDQLVLTDRLLAAETALANRASATGASASDVHPDPAAIGSPDLDAFYEAFEDAFRGDTVEVMASLSAYLDHLTDLPDGPIVDVGCGRGEWLKLLADNDHRAYGFDTNRVAIERCLTLGVDARHGDGVAHLETVPAGSVAAVSSFHVVEHLTFAELHRFAVAASRAIMPGGRLIIETPNCLNVQVGASSFWLDPTHLAPVHPEQLRFLLEHVGFASIDVFGRNPDEADAPSDLDPDPARNGLLVAFHRLVFGSVDLAVVATKPQ